MCKIAEWFLFFLFGIGSIYDWKKREIPLWLLVFMSVVVVGSVFFCDDVSLLLRITGGLIGLLFLFVSKCTKEAVGYADSWLILLLGVQLGSRRAMQLIFAASFLAAICALIYLCLHRWRHKSSLPFVPFLTISYLGVILL